ncbi:hypothetical protein ASPZODRAFT_136041 [Penicilliopsis zonata CBS 506.65]|uniref:AB hydrolase-1 domain-containing protein n=1 Tax=Penicilliopsis zonata CBS 506.65 TaxID=1073090 RepID=A0A1L9S8V2_9EURO|nr:hypothetical protein ASPZODRAFT_136041 [Penicilliopsis zonata CBS 506.65]OJJ43591.1 hypothetical protein ASPZODRAFT_136041 [Penicilliopsis zonata CBS 506.65]
MPSILIVPGFWEGPTVFSAVSSLLQSQGYTVETAVLPSTGTVSPGNPTMGDDILSIRTHIERLVVAGEDVLLVLHSAGGFLGSEAMQGLDRKTRHAAGETGGVVGIVFLAAAVFPQGYTHQPLPFAVVENGSSYCAQPETILFNDLSESDKTKWLAVLKPQPAHDWDGTVSYTGWKDVPSVYLICEEDQAIPVSLQEQLAALAGSSVQRCRAGHMVHLSLPERVVEVVCGLIDLIDG